MNSAATSGPPGHTFGQAFLGKVEILVLGREQLHHEVGGDGSNKSGRQGTRGKFEVPKKETGPLIPGVGVTDRLEVNKEDQTCSDERRLRNVREGLPGGQLGGQSGRVGSKILLGGSEIRPVLATWERGVEES